MRLLIRNARIADGTGAPIREGDVLVEGEHVAEVFETSLAPDEVLDAGGMLLAPGFIDVHSHNDFTLPGEGDAQAKLLQGVTTEVVGNCGLGVTPANPRVEQFYALLSPMIFGDRSQACFEDLDAYRALLHERGISVNAAVL
ncbi:MAG: amidohydrolase family protein, partial [Sandaracinaceae bacterium]|nr:amidohydrolase family protein [Sandaracinaceae bacterium]